MINGYIPAARFLPFLSWTDVAALPDKSNTVIVLPTGAIEQHGPHLPCSVDSVISSGVAGHALARLPATIPAYAIPPIVYGKSEEHLHFPGTLTLSGDTLLHTLLEIAESLYRAGFRKLLMINGHGGQPQILQIACREMRLRHGDFIAIPHDVFNVPNCEKQFLSPHEQRMAMHAGHSETALMLALAPECVHMERAVANFPPEFPCPTLSKGRPAAAWASCSAWLNRSAATQAGSLFPSATTRISLGPAIMSMSTCPNTFRLAAATKTPPGPTILSTWGTVSVP